MHTRQTRSLLLAAGRRSAVRWLRAGRLSDPGVQADTFAAYARLAAAAPWPKQARSGR